MIQSLLAHCSTLWAGLLLVMSALFCLALMKLDQQ